MNILITGGTTFVSKYAAEYFVAKENDVTVINRGSRTQVNGVTHINCDRTALGDRLKGKHFDLILDITAYTEEHIKTLLDSGVTFDDYIFISSSAVYPETNPQPFTEEQSCGYNAVWGDYGMNKLKAERYLQANVPNAYILRPPYFYGVYENLYREAFVFDCAMRDRPFYIPQNGDMKLQFFHVSDLCRFVEILTDKRPENHIFNVGNKDTVTVKEWVELCYKAVGKTAEFVSVSKDVPQRDYFCFYDYEYVLDVSKQNELMPDTVPLEQGLKEEFEWYKDNLNSVYNRKPYMEYIDNKLKQERKMELWDAYDKDFNLIKGITLKRGEKIDDGIFHLVCDIIVRHTNGDYLIMQRDIRKHYGGMWEATAGGSALMGESPLQCAVRELFEETGIKSETLTEVGRVVDEKYHSAYVEYLCITDCDKSSVKLQDGETSDFRWVDKDTLLNMKKYELVTERMELFIDELK